MLRVVGARNSTPPASSVSADETIDDQPSEG